MRQLIIILAYVLFVIFALGGQIAYNFNKRMAIHEYRQNILKRGLDGQRLANEKLVELLRAEREKRTQPTRKA